MSSETHIHVSDIPPEGLFLNFSELAKVIPEIDEYCSVSHADGRLEIHKSASEIKISGWVRGRLELTCDRCLNSFASDVETSFFYLLKPSREFHRELKPDHELSRDEIDVYWYEDGEIRAEDLFREQIVLQLPMRLLCSPGCKGICPGCGEDLNLSKCRCKEAKNHGPFAVLAGIKTV